MRSPLRALTMLVGVLFSFQGAGWMVDPARSAASLGMPLLDGLARSSQVGDFAAFFLVAGLTIVAGSRPGRAHLLYFPAALVGGSAIMRTLAWALQGAAFAATFIGVEAATGILLLLSARRSSDLV